MCIIELLYNTVTYVYGCRYHAFEDVMYYARKKKIGPYFIEPEYESSQTGESSRYVREVRTDITFSL